MARLIDADKLREKAFVDVDSGEPFIGLQELEEAPTVDAVEVVRCKDCKHWCEDTLSCMCGNHYDDNWYGEDFCSYGERRSNG